MRMVIYAPASYGLHGSLTRRVSGDKGGGLGDCGLEVCLAFSGRLEWYEILGVLLRDLVATIAFVATLVWRRPRAIPARAGGKAVTVAQVLTLVAFLADSPHLRPLAWATTAIALYAIWDYYRVAPTAERRVGGGDER